MTKPVLIAQISDLHIKRPGETAYGIVDTAAALGRCVAHLNAMQPQPDFVVISGDLVDGGTPEEYAHLKTLLAPLRAPFAAIPGNHDARAAMRAAFPGQPYARPTGATNLRIAAGGLDLVLLDSLVPGKPHGLLEAETLAWLDRTLASGDRPALLFLHHPPFRTGIEHMDVQNLQNADELAPLVRRHSRIRLIAAGHVHRATLAQFAGVPATICPAPNHAVVLDLDASLVPSFALEPPAFHLHAWFAERGGLVTHFVPIGNFDGPHPFFDARGKLL
jgi:3',5'-cyclic AMP phosphodiesterase CpdA